MAMFITGSVSYALKAERPKSEDGDEVKWPWKDVLLFTIATGLIQSGLRYEIIPLFF